jgi:hypothetical protein
MHLEIRRSNAGGIRGYRVFNTDTGKYMSNEAVPLETAKKMRTDTIVSEMSKSHRPPKLLNMKAGGMVPDTMGHPAIEGRPHDRGDTIPSILEVGELVVPVEHTPMVVKFLKSKGVKLPNM